MFNLLLKFCPKSWRVGLGLRGGKLDDGNKSLAAENQATINQLRAKLYEANKELDELRTNRFDVTLNAQLLEKDELDGKLELLSKEITEIKDRIDTTLNENNERNTAELHEKDTLIQSLREEIAFNRELLEEKLKNATDSISDIGSKLEKKSTSKTSEALKGELEAEQAKYAAILVELETERSEHQKQKNAMAQMWKFIHTRHRLNQPADPGSIREVLQKLDRQ